MDEALAALAPEERVVAAGGEEIAVSPLTVGQIAQVMREAAPLLRDGELDLYRLLAEEPGSVIRIVAVASRREPGFIEGLLADEFLALAEAVWEVNRDFFERRVAPVLGRLTERLGAGGTPFSGSSPTATP